MIEQTNGKTSEGRMARRMTFPINLRPMILFRLSGIRHFVLRSARPIPINVRLRARTGQKTAPTRSLAPSAVISTAYCPRSYIVAEARGTVISVGNRAAGNAKDVP